MKASVQYVALIAVFFYVPTKTEVGFCDSARAFVTTADKLIIGSVGRTIYRVKAQHALNGLQTWQSFVNGFVEDTVQNDNNPSHTNRNLEMLQQHIRPTTQKLASRAREYGNNLTFYNNLINESSNNQNIMPLSAKIVKSMIESFVFDPLDTEHQDILDRYYKHAIWYTSHNFAHDTRGMNINHIVYPIADIIISKGIGRSSTIQSIASLRAVKTITDAIPAQEKYFLTDNGKLVAAAGITRAIHVLTDPNNKLSYSQNAHIFAQDAMLQIGCKAVENYVVNPTLDYGGFGYYSKMIANAAIVVAASFWFYSK
jgi:hypothetical protein